MVTLTLSDEVALQVAGGIMTRFSQLTVALLGEKDPEVKAAMRAERDNLQAVYVEIATKRGAQAA